MAEALQECSSVMAEIAGALRIHETPVLPAAACQHLSTCSRCRAGLLLLVRSFESRLDRDAASQSCQACQADLAAFIDLEAESAALAAATYPHVWWHLWTCSTCAQTYEFTHALLAAQQAGQLAPPPFPRRAAQRPLPIVWQQRLSRPMLAYALPQRTSAAAMRGTDDRYVLFDTIADGPERRRFVIAAEEQEDSFWNVFVTIAPPLDGLLLLTIGALRLVAPFNSEGRATANHIPSDVLLPPDSSEIEIEIASVGEL